MPTTSVYSPYSRYSIVVHDEQINILLDPFPQLLSRWTEPGSTQLYGSSVTVSIIAPDKQLSLLWLGIESTSCLKSLSYITTIMHVVGITSYSILCSYIMLKVSKHIRFLLTDLLIIKFES